MLFALPERIARCRRRYAWPSRARRFCGCHHMRTMFRCQSANEMLGYVLLCVNALRCRCARAQRAASAVFK